MIDAITQAVFRHRLEAIADEMGETLGRTASSPNIKERRDFSCAVFDPEGRLVAQAAHIPVHLGSMPMSVAAAIAARDLDEGDVVIVNDPFAGGTHLPDVTMVTPVVGKHRLGYVATRAHHMDIGGMTPGSMPMATETYQEGVAIPPVYIQRQGEWNVDLLDVLARNVRTPDELRSDLTAQAAAQTTGAARLSDLADREGIEVVAEAMSTLISYSERAMRRTVAEIPDGVYTAEDHLESGNRPGELIRIGVRVTVEGDIVTVDFTGSSPQVADPLNSVMAITASAVMYCFLCLMDIDVPVNAGCFAPIEIVAPAGTVVNAERPAAVSGGNVETSQRIVDVVLRALAVALPGRVPAAGQGTMNNVTFGGWDPVRERHFAYYETIGGGMGGSPQTPGLSGVHVAMSNTLNTPVEALEYDLPVRIERYRLRPGSGGAGHHRGGSGIEREYRFLVPVRGTVISDRRVTQPWGLAGGSPGGTGENRMNGELLHSKVEFSAEAGDRLYIATPGGGGWGDDAPDKDGPTATPGRDTSPSSP